MATLNVSAEGRIYIQGQSTWANARDATSGTVAASTITNNTNAYHTSGRGSNDYRVTRVFMYFDTSGITDTLADATIKLYGYSGNTGDLIIVKSTAFGGDGGTSLAAGDIDNFDDSTPYSSEFTSMTSGQWNEISLNATALADIKNNDAFIICIMDHDYDFQDSAPSNASSTCVWRSISHTSTTTRPDLEYNVQIGYSHDVCGLAAGSIAKVNTVAAANVGKVSGT